ncbi:hypothetical protein A8V01_19265 [Novosphingobium guangzhouense]|uniref:Uncharacterized protein n=1 Tax=Novosphingobium guangzhouense TaxID=1850347 RepID=A0A2K2G0H7_9SPHN|nr:hypothetical protein A8V01_19265 [Novosphingobium guangzhouense]
MSENLRGLVLGCPIGNKYQQLCEHLAERGFTRKCNLKSHKLNCRSSGLDRTRLRLRFRLIKPR